MNKEILNYLIKLLNKAKKEDLSNIVKIERFVLDFLQNSNLNEYQRIKLKYLLIDLFTTIK